MKFSSVTSQDVLSLIQVTGLSAAPVTAKKEIKARAQVKTLILAASQKNKYHYQFIFDLANPYQIEITFLRLQELIIFILL